MRFAAVDAVLEFAHLVVRLARVIGDLRIFQLRHEQRGLSKRHNRQQRAQEDCSFHRRPRMAKQPTNQF